MPRTLSFIDFMLPTLVEEPPLGDDWIHEIKYDGYRTQLILEAGKVGAYARRGVDWTGKYGPIVEAASVLPAETAIIDGEVVAHAAATLPRVYAVVSAAFLYTAVRATLISQA